MKIPLPVMAFAVFVLAHAMPASSQDQATGAAQAPLQQSLSSPCDDPTMAGSELCQFNDTYPQTDAFCSDDIASRSFCEPLVDNTPKVMGNVCQSYRAGNLPDVHFHPGAGFFDFGETDLRQFCDRFFPLSTGTLCELGGAECKLPRPMPLGSQCKCNLPSGSVAGTVASQ
jgi:hypothetical protein